LIPRQIRELAAGARPGLIHHAEVAIEEHARSLGLTQDRFLILAIDDRIFLDDLLGRHTQVSGQGGDILAGDIHAGFSATVGATLAIDLFLHLTGDPAKEALGIMVLFEKAPKAEILASIRLREVTDLDEVGNHASSILLLLGD